MGEIDWEEGSEDKAMTTKESDKSNIKRRIEEQQRLFLEAFTRYQGIISATCQMTNINRSTYYDWLGKYSKFRKEVNRIKKEQCGYVEDKLLKAIAGDNITAIIFYLGRKHPDYKMKQEITFEKESIEKIEKAIIRLARQ